MQFFDTTSKSGLCQDADYWVGTNTTYYPLVDKARSATEWVRRVGVWIWQSSGDWEFDDSNFTTLPFAKHDLEDLQESVTLPTSVFKVERVEVMDIAGNYQQLIPIDQSDIKRTALSEFHDEPGMPVYFDLVGQSIMFYPPISAAAVTLTDGVQVLMGRDIDPFVSTDTTKEPGFTAYFHRIVSVGMALDYATKQGLNEKVVILSRILYGDPTMPDNVGLKKELQEAYGSRNRARKNKLNITERIVI